MNNINSGELQIICQHLEFSDMLKLMQVSTRLCHKIKRLPNYQIMHELKTGNFEKRQIMINYLDTGFYMLLFLYYCSVYLSLRYMFTNYTYHGMIIIVLWQCFKYLLNSRRTVKIQRGLFGNSDTFLYVTVDMIIFSSECCLLPEKTTELLFRIVSISKQFISHRIIDVPFLILNYLPKIFIRKPWADLLTQAIARNTRESNNIGQKILHKYRHELLTPQLESYLLESIKYDNIDMYICLNDMFKFKDNILELISPSVDMECILSGLYFDSDVIMKYWLSRNLVSGRTLLG